jgi:hypothetical protein
LHETYTKYYLQKIQRNVPVTKIRKWNIIDAGRRATVSWNSILSIVICNCVIKGGADLKIGDEEEEDQVGSDWKKLQEQMVSILSLTTSM